MQTSKSLATTVSNQTWAWGLIQKAYPIWKTHYIRSTGMVYAYDWSTQYIGGWTPHPNSAISEGQSYAMLMSVAMNDKTTFDSVWAWTKKNMQTRQDHLFNWWTATLSNGTYGPVVQSVAPDGDELIAYSLLKAQEKWGGTYSSAALPIIHDLWREVVVKAPTGKLYFASGIAGNVNYITNLYVAPSYQMPEVFRKFAQYDTTNSSGWLNMTSNAYGIINQCSALSKANLPPDWCVINIKTGTAAAASGSSFAADAKRILWHISMDAAGGNTVAINYLKTHNFLSNYLLQGHPAPAGVQMSGQIIPYNYGFNSAMTMLLLTQLNRISPTMTQTYYNKYAAPSVNQLGNLWYIPTPSYYDAAITWFSLYAISAG